MSNPIRKKHIGEPGNPGQFGSGPRPRPAYPCKPNPWRSHSLPSRRR